MGQSKKPIKTPADPKLIANQARIGSQLDSLKAIELVEIFLEKNTDFFPNARSEENALLTYGFFWHGMNCALKARDLILEQNEGPAAALTRVSLEHSVYMEWIRTDQDAVTLFQQYQEYLSGSILKSRVASGYKLNLDVANLKKWQKKPITVDFSFVISRLKRYRPDLEGIHKNLSFYVHPSWQSWQIYSNSDSKPVELFETAKILDSGLAWYCAISAYRLAYEYSQIDESTNWNEVLRQVENTLGLI